MANEVRVHVRIAEELKADMDRLKKATGLDDAAIVRACLESVVDYFNEHEEITLPLVVLPKSALKKLRNFDQGGAVPSADVAGRPSSSTSNSAEDTGKKGIHRLNEMQRVNLNEDPPQARTGKSPVQKPAKK